VSIRRRCQPGLARWRCVEQVEAGPCGVPGGAGEGGDGGHDSALVGAGLLGTRGMLVSGARRRGRDAQRLRRLGSPDMNAQRRHRRGRLAQSRWDQPDQPIQAVKLLPPRTPRL